MRLLAWGLSILMLLCLGSWDGGRGFSIPGTTAPPAGLHYDRNAVVYTVGLPIQPNKPSNSGGPHSTGGAINVFVATPPPPPGLSIDAITV